VVNRLALPRQQLRSAVDLGIPPETGWPVALLRPEQRDHPTGFVPDLLPEVHAAAERRYEKTGVDLDVLG
jgi:hypothetical protein